MGTSDFDTVRDLIARHHEHVHHLSVLPFPETQGDVRACASCGLTVATSAAYTSCTAEQREQLDALRAVDLLIVLPDGPGVSYEEPVFGV